jgi:alpha-mannosidase
MDESVLEEPNSDTEMIWDAWFDPEEGEYRDEDFIAYCQRRIELWKNAIPEFDALRVYQIGQSHIDVAWLWRYAQTRQKSLVTFRKAIKNCKAFPDTYSFSCSQAQLLQWVKEDDPALFADIQAEVQKGTFELVGGSWVEPDCMLPSGEAFCRQRFYGQHFNLEHFGRISEIEWFLDSFGYNYGLPQILKKTGAKYFWTTKISWNYESHFPFVNFWWQGPDGTRLLTHHCTLGYGPVDSWNFWAMGRYMLPEGLGVSEESAGQSKIWDYTQDYDDLADEVLYPEPEALNPAVGIFYGRGDGGHGPMYQEVAQAQKLAELSPTMRVGKAIDFFTDMAQHRTRFPTFSDELYLENHRGTYTTQSQVKRHNRRLENDVISAESLAALLQAAGIFGGAQPEMDETWKIILKNQFHDVLPGSSIPEVYDDTCLDWGACDHLIGSTLTEVAAAATGPGAQHSYLLYNPVSWDRLSPVFIPAKHGETPADAEIELGGQKYPAQAVPAEPAHWLEAKPAGWWAVVPLKGHQSVRVTLVPAQIAPRDLELGADGLEISNGLVTVRIDGSTGAVTTISAKTVSEAAGVNNVLTAPSNLVDSYHDLARQWPAWNIYPKFRSEPKGFDQANGLRIEAVKGSVMSQLRVSRVLNESPVVQLITLYEGVDQVFFEFITDWREALTINKVAFHTATGATETVSDTAYSYIRRSTQPETTADKARWEKMNQKYSDMGSPDGKWGVAFLNEGKYGFSTQGATFEYTVLKCARYPGPAGESWANMERAKRKQETGEEPDLYTDRGEQRVRYSVFPHAGTTWSSPDGALQCVVKNRADEYNQPVLAVAAGESSNLPEGPLAVVAPAAIYLAAAKWAIAGDGLVVRVVERTGKTSGTGSIGFTGTIAARVTGIQETDILERPLEGSEATWTGERLEFPFKPFEIKTFKLLF